MADTDPFAKTGDWQGSDSAQIAREPTFAAPSRVGRYRIERELGTGGFGVVYLATDEQLGRQVAVKIPHQYLIESRNNAADYLREAKTVANLDHANIVPVHDVGSTESFPCYVVSKYIEGGDLAKTMELNPLGFREAAAIIATLADALHYAHQRGVVHRDIKPSNILLTAERTPYLVDFGLALREGDPKTGSRFIGTPAYTSPEQARGEGHRIDGRSDIFSLGVVMYELLSGRKPFIANSTVDVLTRVISDEPKPLRQVNDKIPKELERICFRALCKRASDRYMTGQDMADDLRAFLQPAAGANDVGPTVAPISAARSDTNQGDSHATVRPASESAAPKIVPKGLRSFDVNDSEFFIELLPGPRDRDGVPDSVRFWLTRIQTPRVADNCAVGVLYGPSGCGKSSLVKAAILPRLDANVVPVYVEATRRDTEKTLLRSLRYACPEVTRQDGLAATLASIRRDGQLGPHRKLLLVIDQFEQWLHEHEGESESELMKALRQCDGRHVQAILLVRDDFWMAISEFMRELDIPLVESQNTMSVALFDMRHATKVLESFGRAYGALPAAPAMLTADEKKFLSNAVNGLSKDGKVVCLDIALFADMLRDKPWRTDTWRAFGGTRGVGVQFLEDAFSSETAPADSRIHSEAAQTVLKLLLPDPGNDIKGYSRTEAELFAASGYQRRNDFLGLLKLLDHKLRLITPVAQTVIHRAAAEDPQISQQQETLYQLTHDFLVHAVQEWLKRKQEETRRGRAQRRLSELTSMYSASPNAKLLPSTWDYLRLRSWTDRRHWTDAEKRLMQAARRTVVRRWMLAGLGCVFLLAAALVMRTDMARQAKEQHVHGLVARLLDADLSEAEEVTSELHRHGKLARERLLEVAEDTARPVRERLRAHLGLMNQHDASAVYVTKQALVASPEDAAILCDFLDEQSQPVAEYVMSLLDSDVSLDTQLHAATILAQTSSAPDLNESAAKRVATAIVEQNQLAVSKWVPLLVPAADCLKEPLESFFTSRDGSAASHNAAIALAELCSDDPSRLARLALIAEPQQFVALFAALAERPEPAVKRFRQELDRKSEWPWPQTDSQSRQQELTAALRTTIEDSGGIVDDAFIISQQLAWGDFYQLAVSLAEFGYRPAVVRPYGSSNLQVAAIWSRDGDEWELVSDVSAAEVVAAHRRNRDRGWIARDVTRYATAADGAERMVFAALWSPIADGENVIEGEIYVAVPEAEHESAWQPLNARGFVPRSNLKFHDESGEPHYTSVRWRLNLALGYRDCWDADSIQSANLLDPWNWRQTDVRLADDGSGGGPKVAATWWQDPAHSARLIQGDDLSQHLARCSELAGQGYRPNSITVYQDATSTTHQAASVWHRPFPDQAEQNASAARRANALVGLWRLGHDDLVLRWLTNRPDQQVRSEFIDRSATMGVSAESLLEAFEVATDVVAKQTLLAALSHFRPQVLMLRERGAIEEKLLEMFPTSPHAGLHSHIELLLRRWEQGAEMDRINGELAGVPAAIDVHADGRGWFVTEGGMTMSILTGPADFLMGSPLNERGRDEQKEARHLRRVDRTYALSTHEVTIAEFLRYRPDFDYPPNYSQLSDCPIQHLDWYDAVRYCRWLSEQENIPEDEMCYPPLDQIGDGMRIPEGFLDRIGYRLPTEAEWEYACRANSDTSRHYGDQSLLLDDYAWTAENSDYESKSVAQLLPNDFGLFDMLGNVMEWCQDSDSEYPTPSSHVRYDDNQQNLITQDGAPKVTRGGAFLFQPLDARSAQRHAHYPTSRRPYLGFRVARTIRPARKETPN